MKTATILHPADAIVSVAKRFPGVVEEPKNSNRGIVPDFCSWYIIRDMRAFPMGGLAAPWCASFVGVVGRLAVGDAWPIPAISDVDKLVAWAKERGVFDPMRGEKGDLIVFWYEDQRSWGHVGIVMHGDHDRYVQTIEANTNDQGSREGNGVYQKRRKIDEAVAFIRWVDALRAGYRYHP